MAWQGNGMGVVWVRHAMCESALSVLTNSLAWDYRNAALQRTERGMIRWKAPARSCKSVTFDTWLFQHLVFGKTHSSNQRISERLVLILCTAVWRTARRLLPVDNELLESYSAMNKSSRFNQLGCFRKCKMTTDNLIFLWPCNIV